MERLLQHMMRPGIVRQTVSEPATHFGEHEIDADEESDDDGRREDPKGPSGGVLSSQDGEADDPEEDRRGNRREDGGHEPSEDDGDDSLSGPRSRRVHSVMGEHKAEIRCTTNAASSIRTRASSEALLRPRSHLVGRE